MNKTRRLVLLALALLTLPLLVHPQSSVRAAAGPPTAIAGETITIAPGPSWPCTPLRSDLEGLMKLQRQMLDENVPDSIMDRLAITLKRTNSIMVGTRDAVTILSVEPGARRVRVLSNKRYSVGYKGATADKCWIAAEAVRAIR